MNSTNKSKQLGVWFADQLINYKKKSDIMSHEEIYKKWSDFITDPKYSK